MAIFFFAQLRAAEGRLKKSDFARRLSINWSLVLGFRLGPFFTISFAMKVVFGSLSPAPLLKLS